MKTAEDYLNEFREYSINTFNDNIPRYSGNGQIERLEFYLNDLTDKLKAINNILTSEANRILDEAEENNSIDQEELKNNLFAIVHEEHESWMEKHKPG